MSTKINSFSQKMSGGWKWGEEVFCENKFKDTKICRLAKKLPAKQGIENFFYLMSKNISSLKVNKRKYFLMHLTILKVFCIGST